MIKINEQAVFASLEQSSSEMRKRLGLEKCKTTTFSRKTKSANSLLLRMNSKDFMCDYSSYLDLALLSGLKDRTNNCNFFTKKHAGSRNSSIDVIRKILAQSFDKLQRPFNDFWFDIHACAESNQKDCENDSLSFQKLLRYFPDIKNIDDFKKKINLIYIRLMNLIDFSRFILFLIIYLANSKLDTLLHVMNRLIIGFSKKLIDTFWFSKSSNEHYRIGH